jgi:hypothetical protein
MSMVWLQKVMMDCAMTSAKVLNAAAGLELAIGGCFIKMEPPKRWSPDQQQQSRIVEPP